MSILGRFQKNSLIRTMPKTTHEFVARGLQQSHQFATVFTIEIDDGSLSRSFFGVLERQGICWLCRCSQQRPDHCNVDSVVNGIICMNWGSRSKSTNYMSWWFSRSSSGFCWSYTIGQGPHKGIIENHGIRKVGLSETHASGNREASTHNDWWKANWWNKYQQEKSRRTWNDEVWEFLRVPNPDDELNNLFFKMVMEWWMLIFPTVF